MHYNTTESKVILHHAEQVLCSVHMLLVDFCCVLLFFRIVESTCFALTVSM